MARYSSFVLYLLVSILVVLLYVNDFGPLASLQRSANDLLDHMTSPGDTRSSIVVVTVDGRAVSELGEWPWNHDLVADLLAAIAGAEPSAIIADFDFAEDATQDSAGFTDILAGQMSWMENVVVPYDVALSTFRSDKVDNPPYLFNNAVVVDNPLGLMAERASLQVRKVFLPAEKIMDAGCHLGFEYIAPDADRVVRRYPLFMNFEGYYYPSLALLGAAAHLNVSPSDIKLVEGTEVRLGTRRVLPIDDQGFFYVSCSDQSAYRRYSAALVLGGDFQFERLKNKVVVVGVDGLASTEQYPTVASEDLPELYVHAAVVDNVINEHILAPTDDAALPFVLIFLAIGALGAFFLPRVRIHHRMIILAFCLFITANVGYIMVSSFHMLTDTLWIVFELCLFALAAPVLDTRIVRGESLEQATSAGRQLPKARPAPGIQKSPQPEPPVKTLRDGPHDNANVATTVMQPDESPFRDHQSIDADVGLEGTATTEREGSGRIVDDNAKGDDQAPEPSAEPRIVSADSSRKIAAEHDTDRLSESARSEMEDSGKVQPVNTNDSTPLRNLGRYEITGTLGRGAMGHVYKGYDPNINRPVALKTIRLDFVNDPEEFEELKERLHREAQAAGKLSHPNIVTIYDVGSEGHLQYIAMEYLEGQTLDNMIKKKVKFNYRIIAQMITQICSALAYAHERNIVHRDIKPANIMVLKDYHVKVMDYGIARVDSSSMTKTGIAMGTPNYISPEQLQGLDVDCRADLFSLGVVMYEILLGRRPFRGENLTSLIYAIINKEPDKPSQVNPDIPLLFDHIIGRALQKKKSERYQKASEIKADLADFVEAFSSKG